MEGDIDAIDFEREFGTFELASLFPGFEFLHDYFVGFYNILENGFHGSPPISQVFVPTRIQELIRQRTAKHCRTRSIPSYYYLVRGAFLMVAQIVFQCSYALCLKDLEVLAILEHQIGFIYLLFCIYYGVEHYMQKPPTNIHQVPSTVLKLAFTKALNKLGQRLACDSKPIKPYHQESMYMPSGSCILEIRYYVENDLDSYRGVPFDTDKKFTMNVEIDVHTFDLLPVVAEDHQKAYINKHFSANTLAHKLVHPAWSDTGGKWLKTEMETFPDPYNFTFQA